MFLFSFKANDVNSVYTFCAFYNSLFKFTLFTFFDVHTDKKQVNILTLYFYFTAYTGRTFFFSKLCVSYTLCRYMNSVPNTDCIGTQLLHLTIINKNNIIRYIIKHISNIKRYKAILVLQFSYRFSDTK